MNCPRVQRFLSLYHDGHPAGREDAAVAAHLRDCPACRQFRESLTAWSGKVRTAGENEPPPRREVRSRALDRWVTQRREAPASRRWPLAVPRLPAIPSLAWGAAAVALLVAALSLGRYGAFSRKMIAQVNVPKRTETSGPSHSQQQPNRRGDDVGGNVPPHVVGPFAGQQLPVVAAQGGGNAPAHGAHPGLPMISPAPRSGQPTFPQRAAPAPSPKGRPSLPDEQYLDGRDPALLARWNTLGDPEKQQLLEVIQRKLRRPADDFVRIPFPLIAAAGSGGAAVAAAAREYEKRAKVVDPRLFRKVTLQDKGVALSDLCAELQAQTGIQFRASRSVGDEKATVFVKEERTRDVMRAISHLFGYAWVRSSRDGEYRYELDQDLRSQLAEEERRSADIHAALLQVDQQMAASAPLLDMPVDQLWPVLSRKQEELKARGRPIKSPELDRISALALVHGWAGAKLYQRLTPAERAALVGGQELVLQANAPQPERRLPESWAGPMMQLWQSLQSVSPGDEVTRVGLRLDRSELGQVSLVSSMVGSVTLNGFPGTTSLPDAALATGQSPASEKLENALANRKLRGQPPFQGLVSVRPESSCVRLRASKPSQPAWLPYRRIFEPSPTADLSKPHVFSSDVWEAIHRKTGLPIVADYYTRVYPLSSVTVKQSSLFDALCQIGDALGVRWQKEGDFVLGRSTTYYWDRLKEVPNRYLLRWQREKRDRPGLSLETLEEMASLPDEELNSPTVAEAIRHCWGLEEWRIVGMDPVTGWSHARSELRFFSTLTPDHRRRALGPDGLFLSDLTREERQGFLVLLEEMDHIAARQGNGHFTLPTGNGRLIVEYIPAGWYVWTPPPTPENPLSLDFHRKPARTAAEALALARQTHPEASAEQVKLTEEAGFQEVMEF